MRIRQRSTFTFAVFSILLLLLGPRQSRAQTASDFEALKKEIEILRRQDEESKKKLEALERKIDDLQRKKPVAAEAPPAAAPVPAAAAAPATALDQALEQAQEKKDTSRTDIYSRRIGPAEIRLIDISMDTLLVGGFSTATNDEIEQLEGGAHDPKKRGFTLQQAELSFSGAVDPYLTGEAHIAAFPSGIELEEAYMTSLSLPYNLQVKAGYYLTEFGIINPLHPHAWEWIDQPVINTRMFGGDGLRSPGFRVGWLAPLPWYSEVDIGMQNADEGEFTNSFDSEEPIGGRPVVDTKINGLEDLLYSVRVKNSWDLTPNWTAQLGFSGLYGPNPTGARGETFLYGTDLKVRWRPSDNFRGWPFFIWQTEAMKRDYTADWFVAGTEMGAAPAEGHSHDHGAEPATAEDPFLNDLPGDILRDAGFYTQALYGFTYGWAGGLRFEYASGTGDNVQDGELVSHNEDAFRDDRFRLSPLLVWQPSEFSRFRLQYNYDYAKHLSGNDANSVWLGAEILYGKHPAHIY